MVSAAVLNHVAHGMAGLSAVAELGGEGFMLEKHSCVTVAGMLCCELGMLEEKGKNPTVTP